MNYDQLSQFSLDERAHVPLQFLSQTVAMAGMWLMMREVMAPLLPVRVMSPVEAFYNAFWKVLYSVTASSLPSVTVEVSLTEMVMQLAFSGLFWMFPICAGLYAAATIWTAVGYGIDRVAGPPAVANAGGEV
jgi:hypothetical protein